MTENDESPSEQSWDTYWHGTADVGAFTSGGVTHPAITNFWMQFYAAAQKHYDAPRVIDIATGNGAVVEVGLEVLGTDASAFTCIDVSPAAIRNVELRFPGTRGIVADAAEIPLNDQGFDIVTSQFGIEYAGVGAVSEAARMLAPGGRLALLLHIAGGTIHKECSDSLAAIERLRASKFVPLAIETFKAGFEAVRGADRSPYEAAAKRLAPAIRAVENIMAEFGEEVAGDTVARLYSDIGRIHSHIQKYDPDEVLGWLGTMDSELAAYSARMQSMLDATIGQASFDKLCADLLADGLTMEQAGPLVPTDLALPLAWVLIATR